MSVTSDDFRCSLPLSVLRYLPIHKQDAFYDVEARMEVKWSTAAEPTAPRFIGNVEYNSRCSRIVLNKFVPYAPAHKALLTLLFIERINKDALAGALRRHNLAARATSVYLEHFFNHKSRSIVEEVVAKFTLDTITIDWNAEKLCKRRFMRIGLSEEDMPTRFPSRGMAWQAPVPPRVWRSSTRCGLGSWYLRLAM